MDSNRIDSIAALEQVVGKTPPAIDLKVIDHLDAGALGWLGASPLMFATFGDGASLAVTLGAGEPGFVAGEPSVLRLPVASLDAPELAVPGAAFGSLFLAPGIGETLRVNGSVAEVANGEVRIAVAECYVHCAKALIRSAFWSAQPVDMPLDDPAAFLAASRFMALATIDGSGNADLSPKGDPAGCMVQFDGDRLWFADRPGNRRVDSFRNIVVQPRLAAAVLVPGCAVVAIVRGSAWLTTEAAARERFVVQGKTPHLAIGVEDPVVELRSSRALARAGLWPLTDVQAPIDPAKMLVAHVKLNKDKGLGAKVAGAMVSMPGLLRKAMEQDYKSNLY